MPSSTPRRRLGQRYEIGDALGSGATSTVHLGRLRGTAGFTKIIAIKRLHAHLASDATLRGILVDEARLVSRISHPNVVGVLDVAEEEGELFLVLEYARGATLAELLAAGAKRVEGTRASPSLVVAVMRDVLAGLHAAHHARDAKGEPLGLVHRDVTPRNVIATTDGVGKILDFGIAKARARMSTTRDGHVRGSLPYMAPEQIRDETLGPRTDVYAASVVLWEALTGTALFRGESEAAIIQRILDHDVRAPSTVVADLPPALDAVVLRGLASDPEERFASSLEMAVALEASITPATSAEVTAWVVNLKEKELAAREERITAEEDDESGLPLTEGDTRLSTSAPTTATPSATTSTAPSVAQNATGSGPGSGSTKASRAGAIILVALALVAFAFVIAIAWPPDVKSPNQHVVTTSNEQPSRVASSSSASTPASAPAPPSSEKPVASSSALAESAKPPPSSSSIARPSSPLVHTAAQHVASAVPVKPGDCPPYYVDDAGVRRFNRECLQ